MNGNGIDIEKYYSSCLYKKMQVSTEQDAPAVTILVVDDNEQKAPPVSFCRYLPK